MNIKQVSTHLERLQQPFDVIIKKNGAERTLYANIEPNNVLELLQEVVEAHSPEQLIIQERKRNGSVNKKTENYPVNINSVPTVATNTLAGLTTPPPSYSAPQDYKDYLLRDLEKKVDKAEHKIEKLEAENEQLKKENFELEKEAKFKDKEFDITLRSKELEQSNGLSGLMEKVGENPALANIMGMAVGRLMGVEMPMQLPTDTNADEQTTEQNETKSIQGQIAKHVGIWVQKQTPDIAQKFYRMVDKLSSNIEQIDQITKLLSNPQITA